MVFVAIDPNFTMFDNDEIPETSEKKTKGTTTSIRRFLNIWPPKLKTYFSIAIYRPAGLESWV